LLKAIGLDPDVLSKAQTVIKEISKASELVKGLQDSLGEEGEFGKRLINAEKLAKTGVTELTNLIKGDAGVLKRLKELEDTPMPEKNTLTKEADVLKKAHEQASENGQTILSLEGNRDEILNTLEARTEAEMQKGESSMWQNGLLSYEANKTLPQDCIVALNEEKILISA